MKFLPLITFCLAVGALASPAHAAEQRIGIIDLRKVFDEYYKTRAADSLLKERASELEKERKGHLESYQKATDDYKKALDDANNQAISADEREKRKKAAEGKLLEIKEIEGVIGQFDRTATGNLEEQRRQARDKILTEIRGVISAKAKIAGYTLVLDTAAESFNKTPVVVHTTGENDITESVLTQLNANMPPDLARPAEKSGRK